MTWKYENHPAGFYVIGDPNDRFSIEHLTGTKKGIKYNQCFFGISGWATLLWNCVDLEEDTQYFHGYFQTKDDVCKAFPDNDTIQEMMSQWDKEKG